MGSKISAFKVVIKSATTKSSRRWGVFNTLLAISAIFISIGGLGDMSWMIGLGLSIWVSAIVIAIIWLVQGSKDPTATKKNIDKLGTRIETAIKGLANEIK